MRDKIDEAFEAYVARTYAEIHPLSMIEREEWAVYFRAGAEAMRAECLKALPDEALGAARFGNGPVGVALRGGWDLCCVASRASLEALGGVSP